MPKSKATRSFNLPLINYKMSPKELLMDNFKTVVPKLVNSSHPRQSIQMFRIVSVKLYKKIFKNPKIVLQLKKKNFLKIQGTGRRWFGRKTTCCKIISYRWRQWRTVISRSKCNCTRLSWLWSCSTWIERMLGFFTLLPVSAVPPPTRRTSYSWFVN